MRIIHIEKIEWFLYILVDDTQYIDYILMDSLPNIKNVESNLDDAHSLKIVPEQYEIVDNQIIISLKDINIDLSAFIVTLRSLTVEQDRPFQPYFYYDIKEIYYKEIELLVGNCDNCLDKKDKERMVLFILKRDLLEKAQLMNLINDCVKYYVDIARLLKIDLTNNKYKSSLGWYGYGPSTTGHLQYITKERPRYHKYNNYYGQ